LVLRVIFAFLVLRVIFLLLVFASYILTLVFASYILTFGFCELYSDLVGMTRNSLVMNVTFTPEVSHTVPMKKMNDPSQTHSMVVVWYHHMMRSFSSTITEKETPTPSPCSTGFEIHRQFGKGHTTVTANIQ
jgi:hypothetical protein